MRDLEFDIISPEAIHSGRATDAYFERTDAALTHADRNPHVVAEVTADQFPTGEFELLAGVKDAAALLADRAVDVDAVPPGRCFDGGPVMRIEGPYLDFARLETALLGFLSHASGIATAARHIRAAAPDLPVLSFGARHIHPSMAAVVERSALLAGFDGFSHVAAGDQIDRAASGTMPHALLLCFGRGQQEAAWRAFDAAVGEETQRVALCDTFSDEVDESLRAADTLSDALDGVRLDTTGSRRGDFRHIIQEVRWELDAAGHEETDIFLSGGLGVDDLRELRDVADGFGVGSAISNADPVDFALDIVAVDGEAVAKRGKLSGVKSVYRTADGGHHVGHDNSEPPTDSEPLLEPLIRNGDIVDGFDLSLSGAAERAARDAPLVGLDGTDQV